MEMTLLLFYFLVPGLALIFFGVTLGLYLTARRKNKKIPGSVPPEVLRSRKLWMIVSAVVLGVMLLIILGFIGLLMLAVAFM